MHRRTLARLASVTAVLLGLWPRTAAAVLDVEDRGPLLQAGTFAMRITNIGSIGNPFFDEGRSFDPSFEFPRGSGQSGMKHADLWVGGTRFDGRTRVSGGPLLEWRPTLDPEDRVRTAFAGRLGGQRFVDDDGDGRVDEERLDDRDDDGDGEVDEDLGLPGAQLASCVYADDHRESVEYGYPNGEQHEPLGLEVRQETYAWSLPGYDRIAGLHFEITNHSSEPVRDAWIGLLADLDSQGAHDDGGFTDDVLDSVAYSQSFNDGTSRIPSVQVDAGTYSKQCLSTVRGVAAVVRDGHAGSTLPMFAVVPLSHSLDPLAQLPYVPDEIRALSSAPARLSFHRTVFARDLPPGQGGVPVLDVDRLAALKGDFPGAADGSQQHDWAVLLSAGPFPYIAPGRTVEFDVALVAGQNVDSLRASIEAVVRLHHGTWFNFLPDTTASLSGQWNVGKSGFSGHEVCLSAPAGTQFIADPNCPSKFVDASGPFPRASLYTPETCVWTDADCDACTGFDGKETHGLWADPGAAPPAPPSPRRCSPAAWPARPALRSRATTCTDCRTGGGTARSPRRSASRPSGSSAATRSTARARWRTCRTRRWRWSGSCTGAASTRSAATGSWTAPRRTASTTCTWSPR